MYSNNKFLGKCWYGGHPWIWLAFESESYGGKRNKLYFSVWEPPMIYLCMESIGNSKLFSLVGWIHLPKCFYLYFFALRSGTSTNPYFPLRRAFLLLYAIMILNLSFHLLLQKHQLGGTMIVLEYWV